jgi:hypothetical protein
MLVALLLCDGIPFLLATISFILFIAMAAETLPMVENCDFKLLRDYRSSMLPLICSSFC